jgi:Sulfotransferase family
VTGGQKVSSLGETSARLPDFFVVGHAKSGTTALYEMLCRHPQVFMPAGKEPWFLAEELHERPPPRPEGIAATLEEYAALFAEAAPEQLVGEASALYLWSRTAAARIAEIRPRAKVVAILREPAAFLRSLHLQFVETYVEVEPDLRAALALEDARRRGEQLPRYTYWPQALLYSEHTRYMELLQRYRERFPPEQLLVLVYDDFRADNEGTVRQVLRFLDLDDGIPIQSREANPTVGVRSGRMHQLVHSVSVGTGPVSKAVKAGVKGVTPRGARRRALAATRRKFIYVEPPPPDEQLMAELRGGFKGEVEALSEYLGRDLVTLWGYDRV